MPEWTKRTRRAFLSAAGTVVTAIAGCASEEQSDKATTSTDTTTKTSTETATKTTERTTQVTEEEPGVARNIDLTVEIVEGESSILLEATGKVTSPKGIDSLTIETAEDDISVTMGGENEGIVEASLSVSGGQSYSILVSVIESDGGKFEEEIETNYVPIFLDSVPQPDRLVGVHYYPWYEMHAGHENWTDNCVADPFLGEYAADDPAVIDQHLSWCLNHGIRWWSISWWGPGTGTDRALQDAILGAERFNDIEFSILYETMGRLDSFEYDLDDPSTRERLVQDLQYLEEHYFSQENYLHFDGRPVIFLYTTNMFEGNVRGGFEEVLETLDTNPYILADIWPGTTPSNEPISQVADALTHYNPYTSREDISDVFHDLYGRLNKVQHLGSAAINLDYVPVVIPGFNDTEISGPDEEANPVLSASPERYARVVDQVFPHLREAQAVLVTSFNEWYENTQIEPNETFGTKYLELTRDELATGTSPGYEPQGTKLHLVFNRTIVPAEVNPESGDRRELAFMLFGLKFVRGGEETVSFDIGNPPNEPVFLEGVFPPEGHENSTSRWLGGFTKESTFLIEEELKDADQAVLIGQPMRSDVIEATVYIDEVQVDHIEFGERSGEKDEYEIDLTGS